MKVHFKYETKGPTYSPRALFKPLRMKLYLVDGTHEGPAVAHGGVHVSKLSANHVFLHHDTDRLGATAGLYKRRKNQTAQAERDEGKGKNDGGYPTAVTHAQGCALTIQWHSNEATR